ncbi:MAG: hypothetical protein AABX24_05825 [Nanoarchaeota archaeon]
MAPRKLDEPLEPNLLEKLAQVYIMLPENKRREVSSSFGGHQHPHFYQGMIAYTSAAAGDLLAQSYIPMAESATLMTYALADGIVHNHLGGKQKIVTHSLFDDNIGEADLNKALRTPILLCFLERMGMNYGRTQPISFYDGMFRAAVLIFSKAYTEKNVKLQTLDCLMFNYAYIAKIISEKRKVC